MSQMLQLNAQKQHGFSLNQVQRLKELDTDTSNTQLDQCLADLAQAQIDWWMYFAITKQQSDVITLLLFKFLLAVLVFALVVKIIKSL